jgi:hypothetical protein
MKKTLAVVVALMLSGPAMAQSLDMMLPHLTFPEGDVTSSTKGCETAAVVCTPQK